MCKQEQSRTAFTDGFSLFTLTLVVFIFDNRLNCRTVDPHACVVVFINFQNNNIITDIDDCAEDAADGLDF